MECEECGTNEDVITFKGDKPFYICKRCLDEKINKGIERNVSIENCRKNFKPSPKTGRI